MRLPCLSIDKSPFKAFECAFRAFEWPFRAFECPFKAFERRICCGLTIFFQ